MNVQHSIGMPARCEISAIGLMSATSVRAAQLACTAQPLRRRSRAPAARRRGRRAARRRAGRCRPCRCRARRSGAGCGASRRSSASHRRRLQPVAQRLVVEQHRSRARRGRSRSSRGSAGAWRIVTMPQCRAEVVIDAGQAATGLPGASSVDEPAPRTIDAHSVATQSPSTVASMHRRSARRPAAGLVQRAAGTGSLERRARAAGRRCRSRRRRRSTSQSADGNAFPPPERGSCGP